MTGLFVNRKHVLQYDYLVLTVAGDVRLGQASPLRYAKGCSDRHMSETIRYSRWIEACTGECVSRTYAHAHQRLLDTEERHDRLLTSMTMSMRAAFHAVVVITEDVQNVHLLLEYRPHIDVSLTCEHDPKLQEYCVCRQNMPQFDSEGIPNQAPETNKPMILNGLSRNREGSDQKKELLLRSFGKVTKEETSEVLCVECGAEIWTIWQSEAEHTASDSLMAADEDCHHLCKLMAPVRHRWSISDVIVGIRNTVIPSDCSALRFGIRS
ncbi:hypothetical protein ANN_05240 [Periplaneta americana]|uniref:Uncharacterized protein n=1 Tax=Periplaneta americana TaxID=6978 RepID=A0ABQ8TCN3_PERAM|nr:hypothetical protein ANN_05240 [Periplaneta americana]